MSKILVTGGCGFIGARIVAKLVEENYTVHVIDDLSTGNKDNVDLEKVYLHVQDINDSEIEDIFRENKFKYVIHQAAQTSVPISITNITMDARINIQGSIKLIDLSKKYEVEKIVFASSAAVYGDPQALPITESAIVNPTSPYGLSKYTVEKYLQLAYDLYGLDYTVLRYSNVYGPKQTSLGEGGVVSIFNNCLSQNEVPIIYGDGLQTRDFIYVDDVAEANLKSLDCTRGIYNISFNNQTTIMEVLKVLNKLHSKDIAPLFKELRKGDIKNSELSNDLAKKELDWKPQVSLEKGLKKVVGTNHL
ncbi:NAD-dependent epimerase/dehydratase family protein [Virgibacillus dokdonensis]|uniref:NAD-dependent epimerase/dehydratase family protein n=1 Tax=Virgibacillus dokdonensis TaxID=302167 RepID=A0ABU7VJL0_9BACI